MRLVFDPKRRMLYGILADGTTEPVMGVQAVRVSFEPGTSNTTIEIKDLRVGDVEIPHPDEVAKAAASTKEIHDELAGS
jgi:hypothetical protein